MVKKLFKHEFMALLRTLLPIEAVVLGISILSRIVLFFQQDTMIFDIVYSMTVLALTVALIGGIAAAFVLSIIRFYKNMYSGEGYLTFTLPVTPTQHIIVKAVTAVTVMIMAFLVSCISFCIAFSGEILTLMVDSIAEAIAEFFRDVDSVHLVLYIVEIVLLLIVEMFYMYMVYYGCISLGQTAKKNRVLCAVGCYFAYYMINQVVNTVLMVVISILSMGDFFLSLGIFVAAHPYETVHIGLCSGIVLLGLLTFAFFSINRYVMQKKLNLE